LQLYPCDDLRRDLLALRCEEKSYGVRLVSPRDQHGHGDSFSAFANALLLAHELAGKKRQIAGAIREAAGSLGARTPMDRAIREFERHAHQFQKEQNIVDDSAQENEIRAMRSAMRRTSFI
jgi:hypothetical protein